jgi:NTE family protein
MRLTQHIIVNIIVILTLTINLTEAQTQSYKPKLGLVLSGGGAKGLAHIGLLRVLDSLGIQPDYITGTSMGSIIGALYSIGYSGDELKQMALSADWTGILSNKLPLSDINIEEKDEYGRYLLEMPLVNWKPALPKGLIEGQALQEYLITLTFPARNIQCFDSLPIPFRCVATDINTGAEVLLTHGSLPEALRASMSIPLIFTPVILDNKLLIDGGLVRNFPVREVIDMGATKVIGSYTGFRNLQSEEMGDGLKLALQSISLALADVPKVDKELCDVMINNELTGIYSNDFKNIQTIIEGGEANARAMLSQLQKIADWQKSQGKKAKPQKLILDKTLVSTQSIEIDPVNLNSEILIKRKFGIEINQVYTVNDIIKGLNQLYGTRFFDKIYLNFKSAVNGKGSKISLQARESAKYVVKFGLHYDTEDAAGILINGTFRNFLLPNSRTVLSFDLAENPKGHFNFYQFIGKKAQFRWITDFIWERSVRNDFLFIKASDGQLKSKDKYLSRYMSGSIGMQYILNSNTLAFAQFMIQHDIIKPQRDPSLIPVPYQLSFLQNESRGKGFSFGLLSNTFNSVFFADKGNNFRSEIKFGFRHNSDYTTYQYLDSIKTGFLKEIVTSRNQNYIRYRIDEQKWIPLSNRLSAGVQAALGAGFSLNKNLPKNRPDTIPLDNPETFYIGGSNPAVRENTLSFIGLRNGEIVFSQYLLLGIHARYHLKKRFYITPSMNVGKFADNYSVLFSNLAEWNFKKDIYEPVDIQAIKPTNIMGYGLNIGYQSKVGPVSLLLHSNSFTHSWYVFFSFGYKIP